MMRLLSSYNAPEPSEEVQGLAKKVAALLVNNAATYAEAAQALDEALQLLTDHAKPMLDENILQAD